MCFDSNTWCGRVRARRPTVPSPESVAALDPRFDPRLGTNSTLFAKAGPSPAIVATIVATVVATMVAVWRARRVARFV